jgi:hypothetical protein
MRRILVIKRGYMGIQVLVVDKNGDIKQSSFHGSTLVDLAKKAGHKSADGFVLAETWNITIEDMEYSVSLYGKMSGRANQENKYEFPPPIDTQLFFGSCILVRNQDKNSMGKWVDLTEDEWSVIYDSLYGGFEELYDSEEGEEEEEEEEDDDVPVITKEGYKKDGFVVDDEEEDEEPRKKSGKRKVTPIVYEYGEDELSEEDYLS